MSLGEAEKYTINNRVASATGGGNGLGTVSNNRLN